MVFGFIAYPYNSSPALPLSFLVKISTTVVLAIMLKVQKTGAIPELQANSLLLNSHYSPLGHLWHLQTVPRR